MQTRATAAGSLRKQPITQRSFSSVLREFFAHAPNDQGFKKGVTRVRPKKDPIQKIADRAGVLYWKWQELLERDEDDQLEQRAGNKKMGRPPVPLKLLRQRAQESYEAALDELREAEKAEGRDAISEDDIIAKGEKLRSSGPGRPALSEIGRKYRHLRRKLKTLEDAKAAVDETEAPKYDGIGRPAMSARERIHSYQREIDEARKEIDEALSKMPAAERIKVMLDNARIDRRDANMRIKQEPDNFSLRALLKTLDDEISALEKQLEAERKLEKPIVQPPMQTTLIRSAREYSPAIQELIAKLEEKLIVPNFPDELSAESLKKYEAEVALAEQFNATILRQIEQLKKAG